MASVRQHGDGWQVRAWIGAEHRTRALTFTTEKAAARFAKLVEATSWADAERALAVADLETTPTLRAAALRHVDTKTGVKAGSRRKDRTLIDTWGRMTALPVTAITRDDVRRWVNEQEAAGFARSTIANRHSLLSQVLAEQVQLGVIPVNPAQGVKLPRGDAEPATFLTVAQVRAILGELDPHWHPLVLTLVGTGLRYGEAGALRWDAVRLDDEPATIHVTRGWEATAGEGRGRVLGTPKTKRSRRVVPLDGTGLVDVLRAHRDATGGRLDAWVFTGPKGGIVANHFRDVVWRDAVEKALPDLRPRPTPHDLRHTHASWLLARRVPIVVVSRRLGHESIQTTIDKYGHLEPDTYAAGAVAADAAVADVLAIEG